MSTEPDFSTQKVLENDRLVEDQNEKTISVFDFTEPGPEKPFEEEKAPEETAAAAEPKTAEASVPAATEAPAGPVPAVPEGAEESGKGKKILVIILTVVLTLLGTFLAIAAGPLGLLALGGIPLLFIFVWPRKRKGQ